MASIRIRQRADGSTAYNVVYIHDSRQTSVTFDSRQPADEFLSSIKLLGADRAMAAFGITPTIRAIKQKPSGVAVAEWVSQYIDSRSGVAKSTLYDYKAMLKNDIRPHPIGAIPLSLLNSNDVVAWVQGLQGSGKTISNKHGLLSAALNAAVRAELIPSNPAAGIRLPRTEKAEKIFLTRAEFNLLLSGFTERWRPMIEFLVVSGVRFGEASALKPSDVDRDAGTVRISRARQRTYEKGANYQVGPTKTERSVRTINVPKSVLDKLDYSGEWLFTNTKGGPVQLAGWRTNVWYKSVARAQALGLKKAVRVHDLRHTCASWMIQGGVPMAVVQAHLGHEHVSTTIAIYTHLDRASHENAAAVVAAALYGTPEADVSPEGDQPPSPPRSE